MGISKEDIESQLARILSSQRFSSSPRKSELLSYLVNTTLSGNADKLKGYAIGVDVFERQDDLNPQSDSIVRVQAGRLRKLLNMYYISEGQNDLIKIDLPKGSYVPVFTRNNAQDQSEPVVSIPEEVAQAIPLAKSRNQFKKKPRLFWLVVAGAIIICSGFILSVLGPKENSNELRNALELPTGPSVTILPFNIPTSSKDLENFNNASNLRIGLQYALVSRLSQFKDILVVSANKANSKGLPIDERFEEITTDYVLSGIVQINDDRIQVTSTLSSIPDSTVIWSRSYDEPLITTSGILKIQLKISQDVAVTLGQPYSALNRAYSDRLKKYQESDIKNYYCLSRFYIYVTKKDSVEHKYLRDCLEEAVALHPEFSTGWAALSWLYGDEARINFNVKSDALPPYERALQAAQQAVIANPENATAHQYLAMARYMNDDIIGFRSSAKRALELNPNDTEILADVGSYLILLDNSDEGRYMVEKALRLNPGHPEWYHGSLYMYFYTRNQSDEAVFHARQFSSDQSLASQVAYAICLVQSGDLDAGQKQFKKLKTLYPNFVKTYDAELDAMRLPKGMKAQAIKDLIQVGLKTQ